MLIRFELFHRMISRLHFPDYLLPAFAFGRRTFGNSGGHFSFASFRVLASLLVIPSFSRSVSEMALILHPTVLNSSAALLVSVNTRKSLLGWLQLEVTSQLIDIHSEVVDHKT
jgi:hypothetical protein